MAAKVLAESGIILTPGMIRKEELPEVEEMVATVGIVSALKYVGSKMVQFL